MSDNYAERRPIASDPHTLRDRIAAVLLPDLEYAAAYNPGEDPEVWAYRLADAVIEALRLHRNDEEDEYGGYKPTGRYRYVTEWQADDE